MKRLALILIVLSLVVILFTPTSSTLKFFLFGFGIVGGIVLIGVSKYQKFDE